MQCEQTVAALHAPAPSGRIAENGSAAGRLGNAMNLENDKNISQESDQQQLLMRWGKLRG